MAHLTSDRGGPALASSVRVGAHRRRAQTGELPPPRAGARRRLILNINKNLEPDRGGKY